jgi:hypothetical protein
MVGFSHRICCGGTGMEALEDICSSVVVCESGKGVVYCTPCAFVLRSFCV